jgi:hypothetical protein
MNAVVYKGQIDMGETMFDEDEVEGKVREMGERYQGIVYHLLQMNCNHFCSDFCYELVGKRPPPWINRLADLMVSVHCLFPPNWLPPLKPPMVDPTTTEGVWPRVAFPLFRDTCLSAEVQQRCGKALPWGKSACIHQDSCRLFEAIQ